MHLSATVTRQSRAGAKNPAARVREARPGATGFWKHRRKTPGSDYFSLALIETPTIRGSL
jgi:uncharacterized protein (DUF736 family)